MTPIELAAAMIRKAQEGVDYDRRAGATCPGCNKRAGVYCTRPWEGPVRVRYHRCKNSDCLVCVAGASIKSVEAE